MTRPSSEHGPREIDQALAFLLPLMGAVSQTTGMPIWRSDAALLAIEGAIPHVSGAFGQLLSRSFLALPLGNHAFRYALPGALASGIASWALLHLCHRLFEKQGGYCRLDRFLAIGAAVAAGLSLPFLSEASVVGGASLGAALSLVLLNAMLRCPVPSSRPAAVGVGLLGSILLNESLYCGFGLSLAALALLPDSLGRPAHPSGDPGRFRLLLTSIGVALSGACLLALVPWSDRSAIAATELFRTTGDGDSLWPLWSPVHWLESLGFSWCAGALVATVFALRDRRPFYAIGLLLALDVLAPGHARVGWHESTVAEPDRMALHLFVLGTLFAWGSLGMRTVAESAVALRLFAARPLAVLVGTLALAACLAGAEDALRTLSRTNQSGTFGYTDEAFSHLPHRSLVLTHTSSVSRRLLAAQSQGIRPDVLVVPLGDLIQADSVEQWLKREPELEVLLRDLSIAETPSEQAIARLVDQRSVFLEPNPAWDRRLLEHLLPTVPLAAFSSHAVGRSDRTEKLEEFPSVDARIREAATRELLGDTATLAIYGRTLKDLESTFEKIRDDRTQTKFLSMLPGAQGDEPGEDPEDFVLAPVAHRDPR